MEDIAGREVLAATRFLYWISLAWVGFLFASIAIWQARKGEYGVALLFACIIACVGLGAGGQQLYWWINEVARSWGDCTDLDPLKYDVEICAWQKTWNSFDLWTQVPMLIAVLGSAVGTHFFAESIIRARFEILVFLNFSIITTIWLIGLYISTQN